MGSELQKDEKDSQTDIQTTKKQTNSERPIAILRIKIEEEYSSRNLMIKENLLPAVVGGANVVITVFSRSSSSVAFSTVW